LNKEVRTPSADVSKPGFHTRQMRFAQSAGRGSAIWTLLVRTKSGVV